MSAKAHVMVVDDDINICELQKLYLEKKILKSHYVMMARKLWRFSKTLHLILSYWILCCREWMAGRFAVKSEK